MAATSIRNMNYTLARLEDSRSDRDKAVISREKSRYWFIERRHVKRGTVEWIFVRDYIGTKAEAADLWNRMYRRQKNRHRLIHKLSY